MADVVLFHHAHGLTPGVEQIADRLRAAGHAVTTPDLYLGRRFDDLDEGVAHAQQTGFPEIITRGRAAVEGLPRRLVYAGFSLGALPAQALAQNRPGALGALLLHGGVPPAMLDSSWQDGVALQVHVSEADPWQELDECRELVDQVPGGELFVYPGSRHLFAEPASADHDERLAELLLQRMLAFLARW